MPSLCLYFKVHQPPQVRSYGPADVCVNHIYEDAAANEASINRVAEECYLPANELMETLIYRYNGQFKLSFSISGILIELLQQYRPDVIASFQQLVNTGCVEILAETYYHSFSYLYSPDEFERQLLLHTEIINNVFEVTPKVFRNTELLYNNRLASVVSSLGYSAVLCEGAGNILNGRSPNKLYRSPGENALPLFIRNNALSDDISFRFDDHNWSEHPLTAEKFTGWIASHAAGTEVINLFMDYETLGVHKKAASGIFEFIESLPMHLLENTNYKFSKPSEVLTEFQAKDIYDVPDIISWEDKDNGGFIWNTNVMQNNTLRKIYSIERMVKDNGDAQVLDTWGRLQCAEYFYYMANNHAGNFGKRYLNPYQSPEEVFSYYTNMLTDFEISLVNQALEKNRKRHFIAPSMLY